jgi:hypothetical protein
MAYLAMRRRPAECPLLMALGIFRCGAQNLDAIGGTADIDWPPAPIASDENDPEPTTVGTELLQRSEPLT